MMSKIFMKMALMLSICIALVSCNSATPDEFFQKTVLNSNILFGFGTERLAKDVISDIAPADQHYSTILYSKVHYLKKTIADIEKTTAPDQDGEKIKEASLDLYKFALPVLENEYTEIAKLKAENTEDAIIEEKIRALDSTYQEPFYTKYEALIELGKAYAQKHNINAKFD